ncbi:hypothetical protein LSH36_690g00010 [Paralvinella palmiformis]|uniref:C2H2-type domain-containing protein n=1 Tax=Paralvinella palmiformis TaxID=53620 RepID=A0AAD9J2C5_9ANNE|nr:hypothetical protein LSH36_690g00010 [Paralvinella palmiformis]
MTGVRGRMFRWRCRKRERGRADRRSVSHFRWLITAVSRVYARPVIDPGRDVGHESAARSRPAIRERPYTCALCSRAFNQKNALQVHLKKHSGEKPHKCPYCESDFTQKGNLKTHIKRAHHQEMVMSMNLSLKQEDDEENEPKDGDSVPAAVDMGCVNFLEQS